MNFYDSAYPSNFFPERFNPEFGLTKREKIAAMALQGLLANSAFEFPYDAAAQHATQYTDALIAELAKEVQNETT
jgi:hypothetical protein